MATLFVYRVVAALILQGENSFSAKVFNHDWLCVEPTKMQKEYIPSDQPMLTVWTHPTVARPFRATCSDEWRFTMYKIFGGLWDLFLLHMVKHDEPPSKPASKSLSISIANLTRNWAHGGATGDTTVVGAGFLLTIGAGELAFFFSDLHEHVMQDPAPRDTGPWDVSSDVALPVAGWCWMLQSNWRKQIRRSTTYVYQIYKHHSAGGNTLFHACQVGATNPWNAFVLMRAYAHVHHLHMGMHMHTHMYL